MTDEMTPERLAEIKARAEAASPGPWCFSNIVDDEGNDAAVSGGDGLFIVRMIGPPDAQVSNVRFVAEVRTDVPALISEVERLRKRVEAIEGITRSLTAEGFLQCDDETKRIVFAVACEEGERRKAAEARAAAAEAKLEEAVKVVRAVVTVGDSYLVSGPERESALSAARAFLASLDKETTP